MKQYFAIVDDDKHEVCGMSRKAASEALALASVSCGPSAKGRFSARALGSRKADALASLADVKSAVRAERHRAELADVAKAEADAREILGRLVESYSKERTEFLAEAGKAQGFASFFEWGAAGELVAAEYKADVAARVLNLAETNPERHLFDWLFLQLRYQLKLAAEFRPEGAQSYWRTAVKFSKADGRRQILDGMNGLGWVFYRGQQCITACEELGLEPPPWTKADPALVRPQWHVSGFERDE